MQPAELYSTYSNNGIVDTYSELSFRERIPVDQAVWGNISHETVRRVQRTVEAPAALSYKEPKPRP